MIELRNVSKVYGNGSSTCVAVNQVDLILPERGFVAILGPSGCGKTTLLNILGGLDRPTKGEMLVHGKSCSNWKETEWDCYRNQEVGFVFQNYYLLPHLSIHDNIALTLQIAHQKENINEKIDAVLDKVGLKKEKYKKPKALSGGQLQRVAIARALISNPSMILADEPTGALDSKTAEQILTLLKEISKDHLVVMVTHNEKAAQTYADRRIVLSDGEILSDDNPFNQEETKSIKPTQKVKIPLCTSLSWGVRNLWNKKLRSILTIIAGSVGIIGVGLILSMTTGIKSYIKETQSASLGKYPVIVTSYAKTSSEGHKDELEEFPDQDYVIIEKGDMTTQSHVNQMNPNFIQYMEKMDENLYVVEDSNSVVEFIMFTQVNEQYQRISPYDCVQMVENRAFVGEQYQCLAGKIPTEANELAIVIDTYNRMDISLLESLGFDTEEDRITYEDILQKEYRIVDLDQYYHKQGEVYIGSNQASYPSIYEQATTKLKIVGILREQRKARTPLYQPGLLYTPELTEQVIKKANQSQIVIEQRNYGLKKDVFTGFPYEDRVINNKTYTAQYQYEARMFSFGVQKRMTQLYYYTDSFDARLEIMDYIERFPVNEEDEFAIRTYDYIELVTSEFSMLVKMFSQILLVFSFIAVFVSAILIAILTYISTMERKKEIGLLRSLGARKMDITLMFQHEAFLIGLCAGILGVLGAVLLSPPISQIVRNLIEQYESSMIDATQVSLSHFHWWVAPILIAISITITVLAGTIPAFIASKKRPVECFKEDQ